MGKYLIANFVTELCPKYDYLNTLLTPFKYDGSRPVEIKLNVTDEALQNLIFRMDTGIEAGRAEELAYSEKFNRAVISRNAMVLHSSALVYDGRAYLFSAESGVGKSTHTRLWQQAFGDKVDIINDDKPVIRMENDSCTVYGTPFDGGSGIAQNKSAPLKAIIFIERGEENSIRKADVREAVPKLYQSTVHYLNKQDASAMLANFDRLLGFCDFYILTCNTDISAAYTAFDALIK